MLRVCTKTLRKYVRDGASHRRVGKKLIFTESDLAGILESNAMRGEVNPYYQRKKTQLNENTNEQQQQSSSDNTAATDASQS